MDKISLDSITKGNATISYLNNLKGLNIPDDYIGLLIIPSLPQKLQANVRDRYMDVTLFLEMTTKTTAADRQENYKKNIKKIGELIDEVENKQFFVCQPYNADEIWEKELQFTYSLLENCHSFPHEYPRAMFQLWYDLKNGQIKLITQPENLIALGQYRPSNINIVFLYTKHNKWVKTFLAGYEKKVLHVLPDIHLLLIKVK